METLDKEFWEKQCCDEKIHGIKGKKKKAYGRVRADAP